MKNNRFNNTLVAYMERLDDCSDENEAISILTAMIEIISLAQNDFAVVGSEAGS